jgi:lipoprotein-anchoring transpeptidase ErfK/SrfK
MRRLAGSRLLRIGLAVWAILVGVAVWAAMTGRLGGEARPASMAVNRPPADAEAELPDPVSPAFVPPRPKLLSGFDHVSWWSPVSRSTPVRAHPGPNAPQVARLSTRTPEGTRNLVLVLDRRHDTRGKLWVRARLPILGDDATGWVPRSALGGYGAVSTHLVVDVGRLTATLYRDGKPIFETQVGVGRPENPTPMGRFYIRNKLTRYANAFYGPVAFGTSARSPTLTDWPAGGFVGIHGTNQPDLLPGRVSHGCIRLRNADILRLERLMPVGTPLKIV